MKNRWLKLITLAVAVVLLSGTFAQVAFLSVSAKAEEKKITLRLELQTANLASYQASIDKWLLENPNVTFQYETGAENEIRTKMKTELASDGLGDIFFFWGGFGQIKPFYDAGAFLDMDEYFKLSTVNRKESWGTAAQNCFTVEGKLMALAINAFSVSFCVNKSLFEKYNLEYPTTLDEMKAVAAVFKANNIIPLAVGSVNGNPSHLFYSSLQNQYSEGVKDLQELPYTYKIDTPTTLKVGQLIAEMRDAGMFPADTIAGGDWGPNTAQFAEEQAAMIMALPWQVAAFDAISDKIEFIPFPTMPGADRDPATFAIVGAPYGIWINPKSWANPDYQAAILSFVDYMMSDEMFTKRILEGGEIPAKSIQYDVSSIQNKAMQKYLVATMNLESADSHWAIFPDAEGWNNFNYYMDELWAGSTTPEQGLEKIQDILDENKP